MLKFNHLIKQQIKSDVEIIFVSNDCILFENESYSFGPYTLSIVGFSFLESHVRNLLKECENFGNNFLKREHSEISLSGFDYPLGNDENAMDLANNPETKQRELPSFSDLEIKNLVWFLVKNPKFLPTEIVAWLYDEEAEKLPCKEEVLLIRYSE